MIVHNATKDLLRFLKTHPEVRSRIRAARDRTVLYSGRFFRPMWKETETDPDLADKQTLGYVLKRVMLPGNRHGNLAAYVDAAIQDVEREKRDVQANRDIIWRALSGIFASNAEGKVSFQIGEGVSKEIDPKKPRNVFAATEVDVLLRNPRVDATTRDLLAYYKRCIQSKDANINVGFISA